jgi:hypothetical protein
VNWLNEAATRSSQRPRFIHSASISGSPNVCFCGIEHALDVAVQCPHDADACEHRRAAERRDQDQRLHGGLPLRSFVLGLRKLGDVGASILKRDQLTTAG